ncbi:hypothetical protein AR438_14370 [Chryseobacterium aquaticum]|uniref:Uncharacterized protein n=1 Tax=Chryseobacterium aquaticum TaxID=452084 RepID=A0A0Q3HPV3_9FLAO|nr:hypothetical protein [Chryseobacterium aquaticum]KQK24800.1 hypothetical protein AR438_14370 [Chryseobacterium aquaticum]
MELKQLNKIIILLALGVSLNMFSQIKMANIENKKFSVNLKKEKKDIIKILDGVNYSVYYVLDKKSFEFDKKSRNVDLVNIIFFSKKYNKGILTLFKQSIDYRKKSIYDVSLFTNSHDNYMFVSSMAILDKNFNYEYFMKYYYMTPAKGGANKSWITIQDIKNYCNVINIDLKGNVIYEDIDDILSNISKVSELKKMNDCNSIIYDMDVNEFFPKKISK